ncbi:hypothetical protein RB213_000616 [Colletotrichum asianum]
MLKYVHVMSGASGHCSIFQNISQDLTICEGTRYAILKSEPNLGGDFIQNDVARVLIGKKLIYLVQTWYKPRHHQSSAIGDLARQPEEHLVRQWNDVDL